MQGDILSFAPTACVKDDIDLLVAATLPGARSVFARYRLDIAGKKIDTGVNYGNRKPATFDFNSWLVGSIRYRLTYGILLTHSCDIENEDVRTLALIRPLSSISDESDRATIRGNFNYNYYHLPELTTALPESYVDLRSVTTLSDTMLDRCERIASLSDTALRGLYAQLFLCMTHHEIDEVVLENINVEQ